MIQLAVTLTLLFATVGCAPLPLVQDRCQDHPLYAELASAPEGTVRVVVTLVHEAGDDVVQLQDQLLAMLEGSEHEVVRRYEHLPLITLEVAEAAFCRLASSPLVQAMQLDEAVGPAGG